MFTTVVYYENVNAAGGLTRIEPLPDQHMTEQHEAYIVPKWAPKIAGVYGGGASIVQLQMQSPRLRQETLIDVPVWELVYGVTDIPAFFNIFNTPRDLTPGEGLEAYLQNGALEKDFVAVWLMDEIEAVDAENVEWVRALGTTTLVPDQWTLVPIELTQQLRAGVYDIVGLTGYSTSGIIARLVMTGEKNRPGCIMQQFENKMDTRDFDPTKLGKWGSFSSTYIPQIEVFASAADTSEVFYLGIVYRGPLTA